MNLFKWVPGRQANTNYKKLQLYSFKLWGWGFDCYLLKYQKHTRLPNHSDPVKGKHWRLNITIYGDCIFMCRKTIISLGEFLHLFRPDIERHGLIVLRDTLKLSFGMAKFDL